MPELESVDSSLFKVSLIKRELKKFKKVFDNKYPIETLAESLKDAFYELFEEPKLFACATCRMPSTEDYQNCPFCGALFGDVSKPTVSVKSPPKKKAPPRKAVDQLPNVGPVVDQLSEDLAVVDQLPNVGPVVDQLSEDLVLQTQELSPVFEPLPSLDQLEEMTIEDVDNWIQNRKSNAAEAVYDLGILFNLVNRTEKYKEYGYKAFEAWLAEKHGITRQTAYAYINISQKYSREDVKRLGVSTVKILSKAPEEIRKKLEEEIEKKNDVGDKPPTSRELEKQVQEEKKSVGDIDTREKKPRSIQSVRLVEYEEFNDEIPWTIIDDDHETKTGYIDLGHGMFIEVFVTDECMMVQFTKEGPK